MDVSRYLGPGAVGVGGVGVDAPAVGVEEVSGSGRWHAGVARGGQRHRVTPVPWYSDGPSQEWRGEGWSWSRDTGSPVTHWVEVLGWDSQTKGSGGTGPEGSFVSDYPHPPRNPGNRIVLLVRGLVTMTTLSLRYPPPGLLLFRGPQGAWTGPPGVRRWTRAPERTRRLFLSASVRGEEVRGPTTDGTSETRTGTPTQESLGPSSVLSRDDTTHHGQVLVSLGCSLFLFRSFRVSQTLPRTTHTLRRPSAGP